MDVCAMLRWKGHDEDAEPGEIEAVFLKNQVPYTCLRTCQPFGVDGAPATPENCDAERACYVPRVRQEPEGASARDAQDGAMPAG